MGKKQLAFAFALMPTSQVLFAQNYSTPTSINTGPEQIFGLLEMPFLSKALFFSFNIFKNLFGSAFGNYIWFIALILTWRLSALGSYRIYEASKI